MERFILKLLSIIIVIKCSRVSCKRFPNELCFPIIGDIGGLPRPPYQTPSQKKVANLLGKVTAKLKCKFIVGVGDNFYFTGVKDVNDPRFYLTFERTYSDPSLAIPWYMIAGNHDHGLNISAQIEYTKVSKRWKYPDYYYSVVYPVPDSNRTVEIVMIDTTMLCWHNKKSGSPPPSVQYKWIEDKLKNSRADYLIVAGHHPILSAGSHGNTRCLVDKLKPLFEKYEVTAYFSGHDHNLQHIKEKNSSVHYFISGSGNFVDSRMTSKNKLPPSSLKFEHGLFGGFILARVNKDFMELHFTNTEPKKLYQLKIRPRLNMNLLEAEVIDPAKITFKMPIVPQKLLSNPLQAVVIKPRKLSPMFQANIDDQLKQVPSYDKNKIKHSIFNNNNVRHIVKTTEALLNHIHDIAMTRHDNMMTSSNAYNDRTAATGSFTYDSLTTTYNTFLPRDRSNYPTYHSTSNIPWTRYLFDQTYNFPKDYRMNFASSLNNYQTYKMSNFPNMRYRAVLKSKAVSKRTLSSNIHNTYNRRMVNAPALMKNDGQTYLNHDMKSVPSVTLHKNENENENIMPKSTWHKLGNPLKLLSAFYATQGDELKNRKPG